MKRVIPGGILIFGGLFMLAGFFASTRPSTLIVDIMLLLLFVLVPVISGAILIRSHFMSKKKREEELHRNVLATREKEVLKLAREKGGELTLPEIVSETSMNTNEADEIMREMVLKQFVDMRITDHGAVVYKFFDLSNYRKETSVLDRELLTDDREV